MFYLHFRHLILSSVFIASLGAAVSVGSSAAKALPTLAYSLNGGATWNPVNYVGTANSGEYDGMISDIDYDTWEYETNAPGTPIQATLSETVVNVANTGPTATLLFAINASPFDAPVIPPDLTLVNAISGIVQVGGGSNALSLVSCIFASGAAVFSCGGATYTSPVASPNVTSPGTFSDTTIDPIAMLNGGYSIVEIASVTLGINGELSFIASASLIPEPATLLMLGTALTAVGVVRRRRYQR